MTPTRTLVQSLVLLPFMAVASSYGASAQVNANFSESKTGGCSPLTVTFTPAYISPTATYTWTFGNGNGVGPVSNSGAPVSAVYSTPQSYTVTLTVKDGGQTATQTATVTVYPSPAVNFIYTNVSGCTPLTSTFTSTSGPGAGTITNYFWDFGDGNTDSTSQSSVSNTYNYAGTYSPQLTVTNSFGCTASLQKTDIVTVSPPVSAGFAGDSTTLCNLADPVQFNNTSSGPGTLTYLWKFGDGTTSTATNPSHVFTSQGIYTITLVTTNNLGCSATSVQSEYINADDFNLAFSLPAVTCSNTPATFTDQSTPTPTGTPQWAFSDGGTANGSPVTHTFASPGTYSVTLTETYGHCTVSLSKTVTVKSGLNPASFTAAMDSVCGAPALVSFTDNTPGAARYSWNFTGFPGDTSSLQNPNFLYTANGTFNPTLTVTDTNGCSGTVTTPVVIAPPQATIQVAETTSPSDTLCSIVNVTVGTVSPDTLVQWQWNFGDGATSTSPNPSHSYTATGTYVITLNYVTNHGCTGTAVSQPIVVYPKPVANFMAPDTLICGNTPVEFINQSTGNANIYTWFYGNGATAVNDAPDVYYAYADSGYYTITLIASNPGCADTLTRVQYIHVLPPFPNIAVTNTCDSNRATVTFVDSATLGTSWIWNFGDGSAPLSYSGFPQDTVYHEYARSGYYKAYLTATNGACTVTDTANVYVLLKQNPLLSSTLTTICASGKLPVQIGTLDTNYNSSQNGGGNYYNILRWQYADSTTFGGGAGFQNTYSGNLTNLNAGEDSLRVILQSQYFGCQDTSNFIPIKITGPTAAFGVQGDVCFKSPVIFTDSSKDVFPIVQWVWNFGDGASTTRTNGDTVEHVYSAPATYNAQLTVTDSAGCTATTDVNYQPVLVNGPQANFFWTPSDITPGTTATFTNSSTGAAGASFLWYFQSDGSTSTSPTTVTHLYPSVITDTVTLIAIGTGPGACTDTITQPVPIRNMSASFTFTTQYINSANCPPMIAFFQSTSFNVDSLVWNFGDGATSENNPSPSHTYNEPGIYVVTLTAFGPGGQSTVTQDSISVKGPYASLRASALFGCVPSSVTLSATASYATSFTWDFGDGTVLNSTDTVQTHEYTIAGLYTPALILTDSTGCQATFNPPGRILMDTLHVNVGPLARFCDSGLAAFQTQIVSLALDSLHDTLSYHWNFGTGNPGDTSDLALPQFDYTQPDSFFVALQLAAPSGCTAEAYDTVLVSPTPHAGINGPLVACAGDSLQYSATSTVINPALTFTWNFGNGDTSSLQQPAPQVYPVGQDSIGLIENLNGCVDTTSQLLTINPYPVIDLTPLVSRICLGDSVQFTANQGPIYTWTPPAGLTDAGTSSPKASPNDSVTYQVSATQNGCTRTDSATVLVITPVQLSVPQDTTVCLGNSVRLRAGGATLYQWEPSPTLDDIQDSLAVATPTANTTYSVIGQDAYHCFADTANISVTVVPIPQVSLPASQTTLAEQPVTLTPTASADVVSYTWSPPLGLSCVDCADPQCTPAQSTTYTVTVANAQGCLATASIAIQLICREGAVHVPSAFTPNGDGINDIFYPLGGGIKIINQFQVFDRWGHLVFSRDNMPLNEQTAGWDGTYNGRPEPPDAYVYFLTVTCEAGETFMLKGTVVLIR